MRITETEAERLHLQTDLDAERTAEERNRWGQFATPPDLAQDITRFALSLFEDDSEIRVLEPALGTGAFFSALLATTGASRVRHAAGVELDDRFAAAAADLWRDTGLGVIAGDFTERASELHNFNLVLTNPPYVRHHHLDSATKARLRRATTAASGITPSGLSGLYVYFLLLAHQCMDEDGIGVWLIPSEFMDVNYGSALRTYLTESVTLERIHRFDPEDGQFSDALVTSAVVVFRNRLPADDHVADFTFGGPTTQPTLSKGVGLQALRASQKWSRLTSDRTPALSGVPLGELFDVRRGIATGANSFFILARDRAEELGLPSEFLRPILPSPRHITSNVVETDSDGYPELDRQLCLLDCPLPEHEVQARYPTLWEYLASGVLSGVSDRYLSRSRKPWYRQERRQRAPFLVSYMGRNNGNGETFSIIWNRSEAIATNVYLMLYPKGAMAQFLNDNPDAEGTVHDALQRLDDIALREEGRVYGGGLHKIEPKELERLLVTTLDEIGLDEATQSVERDRQLNLW